MNESLAQAAERLLERKRLGLESAIETLETVGYTVEQSKDGHYRVTPVSSRAAAEVTTETISDATEFLDEYPHLLTPRGISSITGFSVCYSRKLCREQVLPAVQVGSGHWFVPKPKFIEYLNRTGMQVASPQSRPRGGV